MTAKASGNKVTINGKSYFLNELCMIPPDVKDGLNQEKEIEGGIIYKGEKSIFSNFFPSPFNYNGIDYPVAFLCGKNKTNTMKGNEQELNPTSESFSSKLMNWAINHGLNDSQLSGLKKLGLNVGDETYKKTSGESPASG